MSDSDYDSPQAFASSIRNALLKGFAIPLALLVFFASASAWLNRNLHQSVAELITHNGALSVTEKAGRLERVNRIDFAAVCGDTPAGLERLRANLEESGVCRQFLWLRWGTRLSLLLITILASVALATHLLNRRAQRSPADLIRAYRLAWRLGIAAALAQLFLLIPLLAYGSFELMTLATNHYIPKVIVIIVLAGIFGLGRGLAVLLKTVPMEFSAPMARAVTPEEAPRLWADARAAAQQLGTTPPDHILVGMEHNFYVTELAVNHRGGQATGRTLYLSLPLLQQLAPDEVMAVIGHELGHFRGDDTRLTREFYPMRLKVEATLLALAESTFVGWTSVNSLLFFRSSFGRTEQATSRERELVADRVAAELTSPTVAARALTKFHVFTEAFVHNLKKGVPNPFAVPLTAYVRNELAAQTGFWSQLFEQKSAHPLDSHPPLRLRLEALGQPADTDLAREIAMTETPTAFARWFAGREDIFAGIMDEAMQAVGRINALSADSETPEGKKLLDRHFPEVRWGIRPAGLWFKLVCCAVGALIAFGLVFIIQGAGLKLMMLGFATVCGTPIYVLWQRHHGSEFVLRADSLSYTGWHRSLRFSTVGSITVANYSGTLTITLHLKEKDAGIWKWSPLNFFKTSVVTLPLDLVAGNQAEVAETIHLYITRKIVS